MFGPLPLPSVGTLKAVHQPSLRTAQLPTWDFSPQGLGM